MIPINVVRKIIADVLVNRSNLLDKECEKMQEREMQDNGVVLDTSSEIGTEAAGTRCMADDVISGEISVQEALSEILSEDEILEVKNRCRIWTEENEKGER